MTIRKFRKSDQEAVEKIFALHWTDPEFLEELSDELQSYVEKGSTKDSVFFVAEENNEVLGIAGFKKLPNYLKPFAHTRNPVGLYVIAAKYKRKGVGIKLKSKLVEEARKRDVSEILLYSPHSHSESWGFHDTLGFERVGEVTPPDDEIGRVWRKVL